MNTRERGMAIKTDINKQGWQQSEFPVACQKCYGENPYMRMLKENYGQQCRLCFRPFTVFKWKGDRGIYKRTCLCNSCSKDKNLCQVCTLDLEFGLPMQVRDKRCGVNGKYLLNDNFVNETSKKVKPPPPSVPAPVPKNVYEEKEAVFIPEQEQDSDDQVQKKAIKDEQKPQQQQNSGKVENGGQNELNEGQNRQEDQQKVEKKNVQKDQK